MKYISIGVSAEFHIQLLIVCKNQWRNRGYCFMESEAAVIAILKFLPQEIAPLENTRSAQRPEGYAAFS
jgi:hypothetical protein